MRNAVAESEECWNKTTTTTTMVATTYSSVDTIERSGIYVLYIYVRPRVWEYFNIFDGGIERRETRRVIYVYCQGDSRGAAKLGSLLNLEQSQNGPTEEAPFNAPCNLAGVYFFFVGGGWSGRARGL